jgi:glycosyltransferase involved in cell wall biosynthesis
MSNSAPFFSIIIPTYNHAHFIGRCLDSVLQQTYQNWEAIVVNNFSEDNTIEMVEGYNDPRIRLINNANGGVIAVSRNKGISEAKGDWVCFLDSDDWWYPNKLEVSLPYLNDCDLIYHNLDKYYSVDKAKGKVYGRELNADVAKDLLVNSNGIPNSSVVIRKTIVDAIGFITEDKGLIAVEDSDYWLRAAFVTNKFKFINHSLGAYWIGVNMSVSEKQIVRENNLFNKYNYLLDATELLVALSNLALRKARVFHKLGKFREAKSEYMISVKLQVPSIKFKSIIGIVACTLNIKI